MGEPSGFEVAKVTDWLAGRVPDLVPPLRWTRLEGGHSNFTYRVDDGAGRAMVLRRPPMGVLLPTAHDMGREFTVISALWGTPVPVPQPIAFCDDDNVTGANFYVMGWVEGRPLYTAREAEEHLTVEARAVTGPSFIDVLASLHSLDPDAIGLGGLGRRDSYIGRQLRRWYSSWNASKDRELPDVDRLHAFLIERMPDQSKVSVVHGDYGLHNCRVAADGHIAAVVDWEISTLGDPLADVGYCINAWVESAEETSGRDDPPTILPGFARRHDLLERYALTTGADLGGIDYYRCFNHWKTVCILQGVYARYRQGQKDTEGIEVDAFPPRVDRCLQLATEAAERLAS
jgi:aminoglycoside phosphotransferase (APT) family kinase protein